MANIGLKRGEVRLVAYDANWHDLFIKEAKQLADTLQIDLSVIQHVGSTSVPGIFAKPIIDIAIKVDNLDLVDQWVEPLAGIGYWYKGVEKNMPDRRFFAKGPDVKRTVYLHIVNEAEYNKMIKFRDKLMTDAILVKEYSELKQKLAKTLSKDRGEYTKSKNNFIQRVIN